MDKLTETQKVILGVLLGALLSPMLLYILKLLGYLAGLLLLVGAYMLWRNKKWKL